MVLVQEIVLLLFSSLFYYVDSQDCSSARLAPTDVLEAVQIYSNEYALDDDHVSYEIASSPPSNSFDQVSDSVRIMVNNQSACPSACTVTLNRYTDIHAYSFDQDVIYDGYNQEFLPICYTWSLSTTTVASRPTCGTLSFDIPPEALTDMNIYDNNLAGIERDHYYTTLPSSDPSVSGYNQTGVLGKVLTSSKSTACSCLVKLQQQFDNQTGYFHRLDHKLIVTGQEPNRPYEEYVDTGETVYCSKRLGDCGATLPLWKHFQFYDVDTVYTTDSSPLPMSYLYPQTPLCYIWPANYSPNVSNIVSGTIAPAPPIQTVTTLPPVIGESTITNVSTVGTAGTTATTRLSDSSGEAGLSTVNVNGSSVTPTSSILTSSTWSTVTTVSSSASTTVSTVSTVTTLSSPQQPTSTPSSSLNSTAVTGLQATSNSLPTINISTTASTENTTGTTMNFTGTSTSGTTTTSPTGITSSTTIRLSDSGAVTPDIIIPHNSSLTTATSPEYPVTAAEELTDAPVETEMPLDNYNLTPETFTLSNFWFNTTTTPTSVVGSIGTTLTQPTNPPIGTVALSNSTTTPNSIEMTTSSTTSGTTPLFGIPPVTPSTNSSTGGETSFTTQTTQGSSVTTAPQPVMVTGPLILIIPEVASTETSTATSVLSSTVSTTASAPAITITTAATHLPDTSPNVLTTNTPTPQHVAQAAPTYSIVGGALDSFTNPPIIAALISSSAGSTLSSSLTQSTQSSAATAESISPTPLSQPTQPVPNTIPFTTTVVTNAQEPGIIWKAGDWISNTWHSVFGGNDQTIITTSSNQNSVASTTPRSIGGLVGSFINSGGESNMNSSNPVSSFSNSSVGQYLNGTSSQNIVNNTVNWIENKLDSTGEFLSNAWDSLKSNSSTSGSFINNTQTWIDGALNSTGGFLSNAWNSLGNANSTSGNVLNNTQTWIGGAVDSTGDFLSNAWNSLSSNNQTGKFVNSSQEWISGALNNTGGFLTNTWNSIGSSNGTNSNVANTTKTWVGGAMNSTGEFLSNAWDSLTSAVSSNVGSGVVGETNNVKEGSSSPNVTILASAPGSSIVESVASVIIPIVNSSTPVPNNEVEWNGGLISGPITV
uniref:Flo11 domain-containing protein n=1 Tax=Caenorhabditis tropicalis TaxID=1561998 RepID=A0A1I7TKJ2_9PELO